MKRINGWWLIGMLVLVTLDTDKFAWWGEFIVGALIGACAVMFVGSIQNAIDHRKDQP